MQIVTNCCWSSLWNTHWRLSPPDSHHPLPCLSSCRSPSRAIAAPDLVILQLIFYAMTRTMKFKSDHLCSSTTNCWLPSLSKKKPCLTMTYRLLQYTVSVISSFPQVLYCSCYNITGLATVPKHNKHHCTSIWSSPAKYTIPSCLYMENSTVSFGYLFGSYHLSEVFIDHSK